MRYRDQNAQKCLRQARPLDGEGIKVGIQADAGQQDGVDLLDIAIFNEFGTETIPARPFMRRFAEKNAAVLGKAMDQIFDAVQKGRSADVALTHLGEFVESKQQDQLRASKD